MNAFYEVIREDKIECEDYEWRYFGKVEEVALGKEYTV